MPLPIVKRILAASILAGWTVVVFGAGYLYRSHSLLTSNHFVTTQPLSLAGKYGARDGSLPKGVVLTEYPDQSDEAMFVAFIATKRLDALQPYTLERHGWFADWFGGVNPVNAF
ncbi:MAG TPA: hypothetical protein VHR45_15900 [Thermoanaerobaculia bacterium]|nr:hypothetical protein [Thermoanaerobaculia bacterium]